MTGSKEATRVFKSQRDGDHEGAGSPKFTDIVENHELSGAYSHNRVIAGLDAAEVRRRS